MPTKMSVTRRVFFRKLGILGTTCLSSSALFSACTRNPSGTLPRAVSEYSDIRVLDAFDRPNSTYIGNDWETLNPGFWKIKNGVLRRELPQGDAKKVIDWFPWHARHMEHSSSIRSEDPSLPFGMLWRRDWQLSGNYLVQLDFTIHSLPDWDTSSGRNRDKPGYAAVGICFGSVCHFESGSGSQSQQASFTRSMSQGQSSTATDTAWMLLLTDQGEFALYSHAIDDLIPFSDRAFVNFGDNDFPVTCSMGLFIWGDDSQYANITGFLSCNESIYTINVPSVNRIKFTNGYIGIASRGLLNVDFDQIAIDPGTNFQLHAPVAELYTCYPLGDTLRLENDGWHCTFVALCRTTGKTISIKVARTEDPYESWDNVPVAGLAPLVSNEFRVNTALIDVILPFDPSQQAMYFTVWKDGSNVTSDPRISTHSVGSGTGYQGQVPLDGNYVGRLPILKKPYRICGLSSHPVHDEIGNLHDGNRFEPWYIHDQPTPQAFQHFERYNFQILLWEDGVWHLSSPTLPRTLEDAFKTIQITLGGPTTRWQMMRHWNVLNPGDLEYGLIDNQGPEQFVVRTEQQLGHDITYPQRNFQITQHLCRGVANPNPTENPYTWRKWRLPERDLSIYIMDARLWRSSQETRLWDDEGWGHIENVYSRTNPIRVLLGEEQYSWMSQQLKTDASAQICVTGLNALHSIWSSSKDLDEKDGTHTSDNRSSAGHASWAKESVDRIMDLLGGREGILSLYGGTGNACILYNQQQRFFEACFGPISNSTYNLIKEGLGPLMKDYDSRSIELRAYCGPEYESLSLVPRDNPEYWNFLEIECVPESGAGSMKLSIRYTQDLPNSPTRGGQDVQIDPSETGRIPSSELPEILLIPNADVQVSHITGEPIRGTRTGPDGTISNIKLVDVDTDINVLLVAYTSSQTASTIIRTKPIVTT